MQTRDLERIHFVTRHFHDLQGLRYWVPLGLITLSGVGVMYFANHPLVILPAVLLLGAFLLRRGAKRYYSDTFGEAEPSLVDPILGLCPVSIFSPAGPTPRLAGVNLMAPVARRFLVTAALTMILFSIFQAISPDIVVEGHEALGQHPRIASHSSVNFERPWIVGSQPKPSGLFEPPWVAWIYSQVPTRPPSTLWAVFAQAIYVLYGSFFLGIWLWRERRPSQTYQLMLALLLLGLSALGASLGFVAPQDGEIARSLDFFLPALVYPGVALFLCGVSMVLAGLLDHRQLVRALGRPVADSAN